LGPLGWAGLALIITSAFTFTGRTPFPGSAALLPVGGTLLLLAAGSREAHLGPARLMSLPPLVFIGDISYSIYLWHWPLIVLWRTHTGHSIRGLDGPVIAVASVVLAGLTKRLVEDPFRQARFFAVHPWRSISTVAAAAVPVVLVSIFIAGEPPPFNGHLDANHPGAAVLAEHRATPFGYAAVPPPATAANDFEVASNFTCQTTASSATPKRCVFGDRTNPTLTVALVGDSGAGQWSTAMADVATQEHWRLVTILKSGCTFTATLTWYAGAGGAYNNCQQWGRTVLHDLITRVKPAVVITADRPEDGTSSDHSPGPAAYGQIATGMETYWRSLIAHGIRVVALHETPEMSHVIPDCLSSHGATVAGCSTPRHRAVVADPPQVIATRALPAVPLVDMVPDICGPQTCAPVVGNVVVYRDSHHLTNTYTRTLAPFLRIKLLATGSFVVPLG
jgi:hypothetical protein